MAKSKPAPVTPGPTFELRCDSQGLAPKVLGVEDLKAWLAVEAKHWQSAEFSGTINVGIHGSYTSQLRPAYLRSIVDISDAVGGGNFEPLREHLKKAENLEVLILQSELGASIEKLDPPSKLLMASTFSTGMFRPSNQAYLDYLLHIRTIFALNPFVQTGLKLVEARALRNDLRAQLKQSADVMKRLDERLKTFETQVAEQSALFGKRAQSAQREFAEWSVRQRAEFADWFDTQKKALEATRDIYHKHVQTEAAAKYWQRKSRTSTVLAWFAFIVFGAMVSAALWLGWSNLAAIKSYVQELADGNSTVSLTPVVVVTVPVLAYAWILRHLSRVFIQNLTVADDAAYRRLMTMTFLGLSHDPKSGVTQAERAIILNALFRPAPPNTTEDGPPTGLLDLITKKT